VRTDLRTVDAEQAIDERSCGTDDSDMLDIGLRCLSAVLPVSPRIIVWRIMLPIPVLRRARAEGRFAARHREKP